MADLFQGGISQPTCGNDGQPDTPSTNRRGERKFKANGSKVDNSCSTEGYTTQGKGKSKAIYHEDIDECQSDNDGKYSIQNEEAEVGVEDAEDDGEDNVEDDAEDGVEDDAEDGVEHDEDDAEDGVEDDEDDAEDDAEDDGEEPESDGSIFDKQPHAAAKVLINEVKLSFHLVIACTLMIHVCCLKRPTWAQKDVEAKNSRDKHITPVGTNRVGRASSDKKRTAQADTNLVVGSSSGRHVVHASSDKKQVARAGTKLVAGSSSVQDRPQQSSPVIMDATGVFIDSFIY